MVLPVVMYRCESWTMKKAETQRIDAFKLWCWRRLLRVSWTARKSNQSIRKEIKPEYSFRTEEGLKLKLQYFSYLMWRANSLENTLTLGCKTQNSGLRPKEEKPRDPINQPSRCNAQEGLLTVAQTWWLWSPGRQSTPNSKLGKLFIDKNHTISILHTGYKVIGYMFAKQSYWHKLRGLLFKLKAILLVQTARAFVQT